MVDFDFSAFGFTPKSQEQIDREVAASKEAATKQGDNTPIIAFFDETVTSDMFFIRPSQCSRIMGESGLTGKQIERVAELQAKLDKGKITELQRKELYSLQEKGAKTTLPAGAKTYCKEWVLQMVTGVSKETPKNKYTERGNEDENKSIAYFSEHAGYNPPLEKNTVTLQNTHIKGTPDLVVEMSVIDIKSSWDATTFPNWSDDTLPNEYFWQIHCYMDLTKKPLGIVAFVLLDTPQTYSNRAVSYDALPPKRRIRKYKLDYDPELVVKIHKRVEECRTYIDGLLKEFYGKK